MLSQKILPHISLNWLRTLLLRYGIRWRRTKTWKVLDRYRSFGKNSAEFVRLYGHQAPGGRRICVDVSRFPQSPRSGQRLAMKGRKHVEACAAQQRGAERPSRHKVPDDPADSPILRAAIDAVQIISLRTTSIYSVSTPTRACASFRCRSTTKSSATKAIFPDMLPVMVVQRPRRSMLRRLR